MDRNEAHFIFRYLKASPMPCLFLASGKLMGTLWKAIYHPPPLWVSLTVCVYVSLPASAGIVPHSTKPKMSSFQSAIFSFDVLDVHPSVLRRQSDGQIEIRTQWTSSCYAPNNHGCQWKTVETEKHQLFQADQQTEAVRQSSVWHEN